MTNNDQWQMTTINKCKWSSWLTDHLDRSAFCKWSSGWNDLLQMIIRMDWPIANNHLDQLASCIWSSGSTDLLQMIIRIHRRLANDLLDQPCICVKISRGKYREFFCQMRQMKSIAKGTTDSLVVCSNRSKLLSYTTGFSFKITMRCLSIWPFWRLGRVFGAKYNH